MATCLVIHNDAFDKFVEEQKRWLPAGYDYVATCYTETMIFTPLPSSVSGKIDSENCELSMIQTELSDESEEFDLSGLAVDEDERNNYDDDLYM